MVLTSIVVFSMLHLVPGDPVDAMMGSAAFDVGGGRQDRVNAIRLELGLNDPLPVQYGHWALGVLHGDLGLSFVRRRSVAELILERVPSTVALALASLAFASVSGVGLGIVAATRNTFIDAVVMLIALGGVSIPSFALGMRR